jgi:acyl-CoA reductase-like NAD-dependent aldehyde dehydrogenase
MATATEQWMDVRSPYSGEVVGRAPKSGAEDARNAVDAAARALESPLPAHDRAAILDRVAILLRERSEDMARTICA